GETLGTFPLIDQRTLDQKLDMAEKAFRTWRSEPLPGRLRLIGQLGTLLLERKEELSLEMTAEMGKPITQARAEIEKCAWLCRYYVEEAENHLAPRFVDTDASSSYVRYDPLGPVLAIMPWNYPFWQVFRFAVPALAAGNTALLKHAPNVGGCAGCIEQLFEAAGFPPGVFQNLYIAESQVSGVIASPLVRAVTLTGSTRAGKAVGALSGEHLKKMVMELGGSNALIVFPDADLEQTLKTCLEARFQNTGQSCIAGKRLLLHTDIAAEFTSRLLVEVEKLNCGDPVDPETYIGVLAREDLAENLEDQMRNSLKMGAELAVGGSREGTFFQPTVLLGVTPEMPVFAEETFGPLLAVATFGSEKDAISLSNQSKYGLGVSIFTKGVDRIERMVGELEEGAVFVNSLVKSDPRLPFGGIGDSGYGRELSLEGIREFTNVRTVYIR
ncbi:MAG: NAD-dependent succinate-semialdehyde dehydrogenase, partial [Robiginitalea sp.]|nr:NAD-dependent succinate-semialdehyde dehydrogenase [Robiginitalea sp.]